jgi:hypothetical protein
MIAIVANLVDRRGRVSEPRPTLRRDRDRTVPLVLRWLMANFAAVVEGEPALAAVAARRGL